MKKLFLYRLFKHSLPAFILILLFLAIYLIAFYKKMDMLIFPYNAMYTIDFTQKNIASTYAMKIDGSRIEITKEPYWKKDFLETSLYGFGKYIEHDTTVFMNDYLKYRFSNKKLRNILMRGLTPGKNAMLSWPAWYCRFTGHKIPAGATVEIVKYNFSYENESATLTDSIIVYKNITP